MRPAASLRGWSSTSGVCVCRPATQSQTADRRPHTPSTTTSTSSCDPRTPDQTPHCAPVISVRMEQRGVWYVRWGLGEFSLCGEARQSRYEFASRIGERGWKEERKERRVGEEEETESLALQPWQPCQWQVNSERIKATNDSQFNPTFPLSEYEIGNVCPVTQEGPLSLIVQRLLARASPTRVPPRKKNITAHVKLRPMWLSDNASGIARHIANSIS